MNKYLCGMLVVCLLIMGMLLPRIAVRGDDPVTPAEVPAGLFTVEAVRPNPSGGYMRLTETSLEIGDELLVRIGIHSGRLDTDTMDTLERAAFSFDYYSQGYFEKVEEEDISLLDQSNPGAEADSLPYKYTWAPFTGEVSFRVDGATYEEKKANAPAEVYLMFPMKVRKAVDQSFAFTLKDVTVDGEVTKDYVSTVPRNTGVPGDTETTEITETVVESASYASDEVAGDTLANSLYGRRQLALTAESGALGDSGTIEVRAGEILSVPLYIQKDTGFSSVTIDLDYRYARDILDPFADDDLTQIETEAAAARAMLGLSGVRLSEEAARTLDYRVIRNDKTAGEAQIEVYSVLGDACLDEGEPLLYFDIKVADNAAGISRQACFTFIRVHHFANISATTMKQDQINLVRKAEIKPHRLYGDANGDDRINLMDAASVLQYYNGCRTLNAGQMKYLDVNADGKVSLMDALLIMKYFNSDDMSGWAVSNVFN